MAILRSSDGKFYEVADHELDDKLIPAEEIKQKLGDVGVAPSQGPVGPGPDMVVPGTGGQVVIQIHTGGGGNCEMPQQGAPGPQQEAVEDVEAHNWCWRHNFFCNSWRRNCWRNHRCW